MNSTALNEQSYLKDDLENIWSRLGYKGIPYSDGDEVEDEIEKIVASCEDVSLFSADLQPHLKDWATTYHLSPSRANILRPYAELLPNAEVLEIGAGCGAITRYLGETGANVLALEGSLRRARICRKRTKGLSNVTVLAERFANLSIGKKFDLITLIGVLEYANRFTPTSQPAVDMLKQVAQLLKPNGILIIAIENQLGLKYFAGALEDHIGLPMYGVENRYQSDQACTFGRKKISKILEQAGFSDQEFLAPFPDYKLPSVIISEPGLDTPGFNAADLVCQTEAQDLQSPRLPTFSQFSTWPSIIENGLGMDLANSFLIAASHQRLPKNQDALAYHYSTQRAKAHCKFTVFRLTEDQGISITSTPIATSHQPLPNDGSNGSNRVEHVEKPEYIKDAYPLTKELFGILTAHNSSTKDVEDFYLSYRDMVGELAGIEIKQRTVLPSNFIDAIPQNILVTKDGHPNLIDKEWESPFQLEFDYLLFRAIIYSHNACRLIRMESESGEMPWVQLVKAIYARLGLENTDARLETFSRQEAEFQKSLNPQGDFQFWNHSKDKPIRKPDIFISHEIMKEGMENAGRLAIQLGRLESALTEIQESTSWKITGPLRSLLTRRGGK